MAHVPIHCITIAAVLNFDVDITVLRHVDHELRWFNEKDDNEDRNAKSKTCLLIAKKCCSSVLMLFQSRSKVNSYVDFMKCMLAVIDLETLFEQLSV